eukprot:4673700-Pleurochrysis_carterae.AAC.3
MLYKWGHPVATLPVTNGTIYVTDTRKMTEILRINFRLCIQLCMASIEPPAPPTIASESPPTCITRPARGGVRRRARQPHYLKQAVTGCIYGTAIRYECLLYR